MTAAERNETMTDQNVYVGYGAELRPRPGHSNRLDLYVRGEEMHEVFVEGRGDEYDVLVYGPWPEGVDEGQAINCCVVECESLNLALQAIRPLALWLARRP